MKFSSEQIIDLTNRLKALREQFREESPEAFEELTQDIQSTLVHLKTLAHPDPYKDDIQDLKNELVAFAQDVKAVQEKIAKELASLTHQKTGLKAYAKSLNTVLSQTQKPE